MPIWRIFSLIPMPAAPANDKNARHPSGIFGLSKNPFGLFRQFFAVCHAHNLFALGEQIPHLQPEMYFCPCTRHGQNDFNLFATLAANSARLF